MPPIRAFRRSSPPPRQNNEIPLTSHPRVPLVPVDAPRHPPLARRPSVAGDLLDKYARKFATWLADLFYPIGLAAAVSSPPVPARTRTTTIGAAIAPSPASCCTVCVYGVAAGRSPMVD